MICSNMKKTGALADHEYDSIDNVHVHVHMVNRTVRQFLRTQPIGEINPISSHEVEKTAKATKNKKLLVRTISITLQLSY